MALGRRTKWFLSILAVIVLAVLVAIPYTFESFKVPGPAMDPTLSDGDKVIINKLSYHFSKPERNDILVFRYPSDQKRKFIKRVIAVAGDTVEIKKGQVFINGQLQNENYILEPTRGSYPQQRVSEGCIFVMGDNRNNSEDSRFNRVGFVPYDLIDGKVVHVEKVR